MNRAKIDEKSNYLLYCVLTNAVVGLFYVPTQADEPSNIAVPAPILLLRKSWLTPQRV